MADEYPFTPYPFSEPVTPQRPEPPAEPFSAPPAFPAHAAPVFPTSPAQDFSAPTPENPPFENDEDEAAKKTALADKVAQPWLGINKGSRLCRRHDAEASLLRLGLVTGILVILLLAGFGIWYFLRDKSGEISPEPPPSQEERDAYLIVAAAGGKILTPEGASLLIPPGALSQDTRLEISKVSYGEVTDLFELKPLGQKFLKPVTVEIPYKKNGPIILEYWREEGEKKRTLKYTVDRKDRKLRTVLEEF